MSSPLDLGGVDPEPPPAGGSSGRSLRYLGPFLRKYRMRLAGIFALTALGTVLGLTYPYFLQKAIDRVFLESPFLGGALPEAAAPPASAASRLGLLRLLAVLVFAVSIVQLVVSAFGRYLHTWVATHLLFDMREALHRHVLALPLGFFTKMRIGDVQARLGADLAEVQSAATGALLQFVGSVLALAGALAFLLHYSVRLTVLALVFLPVAVALLLLFQRRIHSLAYRIREENTDITANVIETFGAVKTIKAFTAEEHRVRGFRRLNLRMIGTILRFQVASAFAAGVPGTVLIASSVVVFLVGGSMVLEGSLSVGALIACNIYLARLFGPVQGMIGLYLRLQRARAALDRVFEFLHAGPVEPVGQGAPFPPLRRAITLRDLSFRHEASAPLLAGIHVEVPAGTVCAIVGRSGVGKTTLLDLLAGFRAPTLGSVEFDGEPLSAYDLRSLRAGMGFVVQGGDLFSGTLEENLRFGRRGPTEEDLHRALEVAGLASVAARLGGLNGVIGERGAGLSAGERARVAIGRAVLGDPGILLLDEALGRLDPEGRTGVLDPLLRAAQGRTAIVVTHDPEVARRADSVLFLTGDGGVIAGRHEDLEREHAAYRRLFVTGTNAGPVRLALIDSGLHREHPHVVRAVPGMTIRWDDDAGGPAVLRDGAPDAIGHGTACAGVIHEAAPATEIVPVRVFEDRLQTRPAILAAALREALALAPRIIHLSLGIERGEATREIESLCVDAEAAGILVVSTGMRGRESMPGSVDTVVSVGADPRMERREIAAGPSDQGVDLVADPRPRDIPGAPPNANLSGPSFAAARVSGIIARLLAEEPGLTPPKVRARLRERYASRKQA